jgi:hypothetical protein
MGGEPGVAIDAYHRCAFDQAYRLRWKIGEWSVSEFPPEILEHLLLDYRSEAPDAG